VSEIKKSRNKMSTNFQGKVICLTGGASGIGLETSKLLASRGAILSIADVQQEALDSAVSSISATGAAITGTVVNIRDRTSVECWVSSIVQKHGRLDGAVNLAGVIGKQIGVANIEDIEDDDWDFVLGVNLTGTLNCMRAEIKAITDGGSIVNAASIAGVIGMPKNGAYVASKHAVIGLTRAAAKELGPRGVRVNAIAP
jgi:NAD(P)-dependent dehydrogenase (short-subunit alcohol dehydrogenase family)